MKVTIEIEVDSIQDLPQALISDIHHRKRYFCDNRLSLLKTVSELCSQTLDQGMKPSLTEMKNAIWLHLKEA